MALAWGAVRLLVTMGPTNLPRLPEVRLYGVAVAYTLALSIAAALVFGAIPLWRATPLAASLHESGRGNTASRGRHRARHLLWLVLASRWLSPVRYAKRRLLRAPGDVPA